MRFVRPVSAIVLVVATLVPPRVARASVGADSEAVRNAVTYNVALDVSHAQATPATLLSANADAFVRSGVAPDSVARLLAIASPLRLSYGSAAPRMRERNGVSWLGRLDDTRDTLATRALTSYAGYMRDGALGANILAAPSVSSERRERTLGAQLTLGSYVGDGRGTLTETRLGANAVHTAVTPYTALPGVGPGSDHSPFTAHHSCRSALHALPVNTPPPPPAPAR